MPAYASVAAPPPNDRDNQPVRTWPSPRGAPQYEQWYAIVLHPTQALALWFRHSLLQRHDGSSDARLWALVRDGRPGGRDLRLTQALPLDQVRFEQARFGLHLGEHAFFNNGLARGRVTQSDATVAWDLRFDPASATFRSVANPWLARAISRSHHTSPNSQAAVQGSLHLDSDAISLDGAMLTQGHTFGRAMQDGWAWGACPRFDDAADCAFEAVATQRGSNTLMSCELVLDGKHHAFNRLRHLKGAGLGLLGEPTHARYALGDWTFAARSPELVLEGRWTAPREGMLRVRYPDVDGSVRYNCNQLLGSLELEVREITGQHRRLACQGRAPFEIVAREPPWGDETSYAPASW
ncbi:MAG: hypothetical protein ABIJ09_22210 [Pseudomonadota bacterium]